MGTIFSLNPDGTGFVTLHDFDLWLQEGKTPEAGLTQGSDGRLYGTASEGYNISYSGTIFSLNPDGTDFRVLRHMTLETYPRTEVLEASDGWLYGMTQDSRVSGLLGTLYRLQRDGSGFEVLTTIPPPVRFSGRGAGGLIEGPDGRLYATTSNGGVGGTLFAFDRGTRQLQVLSQFSSAAAEPCGVVTLASDGKFYGTTFAGAVPFDATVYSFDPANGVFSVPHWLDRTHEGASPYGGIVEGLSGRLYSTTHEGTALTSTLFSLNKDGSDFRIVWDFRANGLIGNNPEAQLIRGPDGRLYGSTTQGAGGSGGIFNYTEGGSVSLLHTLQLRSSGTPASELVEGTDGRLFGTTSLYGYTGWVYAVNKDGAGFTVLRRFSDADGGAPQASLASGHDGRMYGTTNWGPYDANGRVYSLREDGSDFQLLHIFAGGAEGGGPVAGLLLGADGWFYGTTANSPGTVFAITPDGSDFRVLHAFNAASEGSVPTGKLVFGPDGRLYGTTSSEGPSGCGTVFALDPGTLAFSVLHPFNLVTEGSRSQAGLVLASDGRMYGTTSQAGLYSRGAVFSFLPGPSLDFRVLHSFPADGTGNSSAALVEGMDHALYGVARSGGAWSSGTVFRLTTDSVNGSGFTVLSQFGTAYPGDPNGRSPASALLLASDGNFYGTTPEGGRYGQFQTQGAIYRFNPNWVAADVTAQLTVTPLGFRRSYGNYTQTIQISNPTGLPIAGPVSLVFDRLSANATLLETSDVTKVLAPLGSRYVPVNIGPEGVLSPGETITLYVDFSNPTNQPITYTPRVLAHPGRR